MTWSELKQAITTAGVGDGDEVSFVNVSSIDPKPVGPDDVVHTCSIPSDMSSTAVGQAGFITRSTSGTQAAKAATHSTAPRKTE